MWMLESFFHIQATPGWSGGVTPASTPGASQAVGTVDTESRVPVINLKDGTRLAGDDAPRRKDLDQWLKEHPGFVADVGAFIPVRESNMLNWMTIKYKMGSFSRLSESEV